MTQSAIDFLQKEKEDKIARAKALTERAQDEGRSMAPEEHEKAKGILEEVKKINDRIETMQANDHMIESIEKLRSSSKAPEKVEGPPGSIGAAFTKSEGYTALRASGLSGSWSTGPVELPGMYAATVTETASPVVQPDVRPGIVETRFKRLTIADLLAPGATSSNTVRYLRENPAPTNAAAALAEGDPKPESTILFDSVDEPVRKIATFNYKEALAA